VNTAVKNGDEKAEKSVAMAVITTISNSVSRAEPATTRRSSGALPASQNPAPASASAQAMGR
jgi:hypothetical protein